MAIEANSVGNKSVLESDILLAGVPARRIKKINIFSILISATKIIEKGLNTNDIAGMPAKKLSDLLNINDEM